MKPYRLLAGLASLFTILAATASTEPEVVFGLKLGDPIKLPDCPQRTPALRSAPVENACVDRSSRLVLSEHVRLSSAASVQSIFIYLPQGELPGWTRAATVPSLPWLPGPSVIATVVDGVVAEFFFEGQPSFCQLGYKALADKYGNPTFTSSQSERAEWSIEAIFASVDCNMAIKDAPTKYSTHYKIRLKAPFKNVEMRIHNANQKQLKDAGQSTRKF
jgi:hypothetical protein